VPQKISAESFDAPRSTTSPPVPALISVTGIRTATWLLGPVQWWRRSPSIPRASLPELETIAIIISVDSIVFIIWAISL